MALYHFTLNQITRSHGQSAVNCAAYRAGEKLMDDYYGCTRDYTRKQGVVLSEIMLPAHAPERLADRTTLWNEVENVEKHPKAQLTHSFEFSLQTELSLEENIAMAKKFVEENFVARGMIADIAIHDPPKADKGEPENPHIHVMCPIRPLDENGKWGEKQKREYLKDDKGEPILDKKGKPKFRAVPTTDWSTKETLQAYRKNWCDLVNATFQEKGISARIDHRSYGEQGEDMIPTIHEGVAVRQMEAKGIHTEKRALNNLIRYINRLTAQLREMICGFQTQRKIIAEEIQRLQQPTLLDLLVTYYDERNEVAKTYAYGTQKAQRYNLKEFSDVIVYMETHKIETQDDLDVRINALEEELIPIRQNLKGTTERLNKIQELIRMQELYTKTKPIHQEYEKKYFGKKKFGEEHKKELKQYQMANRILRENLNSAGKVPLKAWQDEEKRLLEEADVTGEQKKKLSDELSQLKKIKKCIDVVINDPLPDPEPESVGTGKERTSVLEKLHANRERIKAEQNDKKQKSTKRQYEPER